jgi:enamine deaminase RidA (YjgF/YER057c/UK114 family)
MALAGPCRDTSDPVFDAISAVEATGVLAARPASTLIGVKELAVPWMKVEIEAVIGLSARSRR